MATQWIAAAQALELVARDHHEHLAQLAICERAHAGLIGAKALRFVADKRSEDDAFIPREFWWAEGQAALQQDWKLGQFSTWIRNTYLWKAFGVRFDLEGVLALLSDEAQAGVRRRLSVMGNPDWITAQAARRRAYEVAGVNPSAADQAVLEQARMGFLVGRAVLMHCAGRGGDAEPSADEREWTIPGWFWRDFTGEGTSRQDWETGRFSGTGVAPFGPCKIALSGVHFLASSIDLVFGALEPAKSSKGGTPTGGRPPAAFWDDMSNAIWGDIYRGALIPKRQADIERAMLDWAEANGHDASVSAVRPRARKMFEAFSAEDRNSSGQAL